MVEVLLLEMFQEQGPVLRPARVHGVCVVTYDYTMITRYINTQRKMMAYLSNTRSLTDIDPFETKQTIIVIVSSAHVFLRVERCVLVMYYII